MGGGIAKGNRILFNVSGFSFDSSGSLLLSEVKLIEKPQFKIGDKVKCVGPDLRKSPLTGVILDIELQFLTCYYHVQFPIISGTYRYQAKDLELVKG